MVNSDTNLPVSTAMKGLWLNVTITGARRADWRIRIGMLLMKLAGLIMGVGRTSVAIK